jgi:1-deoxy-D-xylulose-5-phosphate synthase
LAFEQGDRGRALAAAEAITADMSDRSDFSRLLDRIDIPEDLRSLQEGDLRQVADDVRDELIRAVAVTGGHLGAGLGVVELTVALHYVFDTPTTG